MSRFILRVLFAAMCLAAVANAFQGPMLKGSRLARSAVAQTAQPTMVLESAPSQLVEVTNALLAAKETDFGGYTGPAVGLVILGVLLAALTNPYDELKPPGK